MTADGLPPSQLPWSRPLGARPLPGGEATEVRTWAPRASAVAVRAAGVDHPLGDAGHGVREGVVDGLRPGDDYELVLDGRAWPDPCSRWQPAGMRGPSRVLDPGSFAWTDGGFERPSLRDLVVYELHVGTFSAEGTFDGAVPHLGALRELGVTAIELMPVADGPGLRGWGYDGVYPAAAHRAYGGPQGLARLVDAAHGEGLAVILDVVHNHVGASGNAAYEAFGPYFTDRYATFWGRAVNYDDAGCDAVREWALQSTVGWVADFHVDGLRLDAIHAIYDMGARHVVAELTERVHGADGGPRAAGARGGPILVIAESGMNDPKVVRPRERGGWACDAVWADDFHHALRALLTGEREGYYADFGAVAQLAKAFHRPHVHDGVWSASRERVFGAPADDVAPERFVVFTQDHDQVGNRALGDRLPRAVQPLAALCVILSPFTPMLWMGEEYGETAPFQFFTDHVDEEIAIATREGRRREFAGFAGFAAADVPDPQDPATFARSRLTRVEAPGVRDLYRRLLALRAELGGAPTRAIEFDEGARWLRVRRGDVELACNFDHQAARAVPVDGTTVALATHDDGDARLEDGAVVLAPLSGAVLR
jgi:maltooligosyltrehalose trehalohydrolase